MAGKPSIQEIYIRPSFSRIDALLIPVCRIFAIGGGVILTCLTITTVFSILGRVLFNAPIPGDFELVELGCGVAVCAFLPYCHIQEGNVTVDLFTSSAPPSVIRLLGALGDLVFMIISALVSWRLLYGCLDLMESGEVTMVLKVPIWWAMPPIIISFLLLTLVCASTLLARIFCTPEPDRCHE